MLILTPVPDWLSTLPVAAMSTSPPKAVAPIAVPLCVDTRFADMEMSRLTKPNMDAKIPPSLPVTVTFEVSMETSPPRHDRAKTPLPADPDTSPVAFMATDPVPYALTSIPSAPVTLATLTDTAALLAANFLPAWTITPVPETLSMLPVAVMSMSPLAWVVAPIAVPLCVETRAADTVKLSEPFPEIVAKIPPLPPVTVALEAKT